MRTVLAVLAIALLYGCAPQPKFHEVSKGVTSIRYYQLGSEPLEYRFGVVDASSYPPGARSRLQTDA